jgi:inosine/xanthosine triphosphatase
MQGRQTRARVHKIMLLLARRAALPPCCRRWGSPAASALAASPSPGPPPAPRRLRTAAAAAAAAASGEPARLAVVASKNGVKIRAAAAALARCWPGATFDVRGEASDSGVPPQPTGDEETLRGALNRAAGLRAAHPAALVLAIEGGVAERADGEMECLAWAVAVSPATGAVSRARSGSFALPPALAALVRGGLELGDADDRLFGRTRSGQGSGTVGHLSRGALSRERYYEDAFVCALLPLLNPEHYPGHGL